MEQHNLRTSQLLLDCCLQNRGVLFSCCHRFPRKGYFICLIYCFSRSAGGASLGLRLTVSIAKPRLGAGLI